MNKNKPVPMSLIQQNCFIRDVTRISDNSASAAVSAKRTYLSLDEVTDIDGVKLRMTENDYPITPEYVDSFSESADYRNDVVGAVANAPKRTNLGDITGFQDVASMDMESARALYKQLTDKFAKSAVSDSDTKSDVSVPDNSNPEVK